MAAYTIQIHITLCNGTKFKVPHHLCLYNSGSWSDRKQSAPDETFPGGSPLGSCLVDLDTRSAPTPAKNPDGAS